MLSTGSTITPALQRRPTIARYYCTSLFNAQPERSVGQLRQRHLDAWRRRSCAALPIAETQNDAQHAVALYAFDSITLLPSLILNLGARYDRFTSTVTPGPADRPRPAAFQLEPHRRTVQLAGRAGVQADPQHQPLRQLRDRGDAAQQPARRGAGGQRAAARPTRAAALALLDALKVEKTKSYEVGAKAELFGEQLALTAAVFQTDTDNARVTGAEQHRRVHRQAPHPRRRARASTATILPGWTVFGGYTYLDPKIVDGGFTALTAPRSARSAAQVVLVPSVNTGKQAPQTAQAQLHAVDQRQRRSSGFSIGGGAFYTEPRVRRLCRQPHRDADRGGRGDGQPGDQAAARARSPATGGSTRAPAIKLHRADRTGASTSQNLTDKAYFTPGLHHHYATIAPGRTVFGTVELSAIERASPTLVAGRGRRARCPVRPSERAALIREAAEAGVAEAQAVLRPDAARRRGDARRAALRLVQPRGGAGAC